MHKPYVPTNKIRLWTTRSVRSAYTTPEFKVYPMENDSLLQAVSGQHQHIGQGGTFGSGVRVILAPRGANAK